MDSVTKDTIAEALKQPDLPENVRRVLEIRTALGKTSVAKYSTMLVAQCQDHRLRGILQFYGANRSGRWAGRLVQTHNLAKNTLPDLALARELAAAGMNVVVNSSSERSLPAAEAVAAEIAEEFGVETLAVAANVAIEEEANALIAAAAEANGRVDVLVNNAGITRDGLMMRMSEQQWDMVINVNLKSAFNFIHACTPIMMRQKVGSIINMASVVGVHGNAGQANYSASKAGMIALAKSIAQELGSRGIRANAIAPGFIMTAMTDALSDEVKAEWCKKIPLRRGGTPEDVANVATFLASDMSSYVSGQVIQIDGGMNM